jgi:hypothetical protein
MPPTFTSGTQSTHRRALDARTAHWKRVGCLDIVDQFYI